MMAPATQIVAEWRIRHASSITETRHSVKVFFRDKLAVVGLAWILLTAVLAVGAPFIAPYPADGTGAALHTEQRLQAPSSQHLFGTDEVGRDVLSRVIYGSRLALEIPIIVMCGVVVIGVPLGGIAGYFGGWIDDVVMRATDLFLAFPGLILAMALVAFLGPSLRNVAIALVVSWWPWYTRLVRTMAVSLRQRDYVKAARAGGVPSLRVIRRHILPNALGPVIVQMTRVPQLIAPLVHV